MKRASCVTRTIRISQARCAIRFLAIVIDGEAVGGTGIRLGSDFERHSAEIGYWLGRAYWGRGIATEALKLTTAFTFATFDLVRLFATAMTTNLASCRVLEKAGYTLEGVMRKSAFKGGAFVDRTLYSKLRDG
jgi:RimJ/RimL family protein N-acetyltransferase